MTTDDQHRQHRIVEALAILAEDPDAPIPPYVQAYLPDHVRAAGADAWSLVAGRPGVLARLDVGAVAAAAVRTAFGATPMPAGVAAAIGARHTLSAAAHADVVGLRQIAIARFGGTADMDPRGEPAAADAPWRVRASRLDARSPHVTLRVDSPDGDGVRALATFVDSDGSLRVVSGGSTGAARVWDPVTGVLVNELRGHVGPVRAIVDATSGAAPRLATAGEDGDVVVWDLVRGAAIGRAAAGAPIWALTTVAVGSERRLVAGRRDGRIRTWDLDLANEAAVELEGAWITALVEMDQRLMIGDDSGLVRTWNPATEMVERAWTVGLGVRAMAVIPDRHASRLLVVTSGDRASLMQLGGDIVTLPERFAGRAAAAIHVDQRWVLCIADGPRLAVVDPERPRAVRWLDGHTRTIRSVVAVPDGAGSLVLASGAEDGTVRAWLRTSFTDPPSTSTPSRHALGPVTALHTFDTGAGPALAVGTASGALGLLDASGQWRDAPQSADHRVEAFEEHTSADGPLLLARTGMLGRFLSLPDLGGVLAPHVTGTWIVRSGRQEVSAVSSDDAPAAVWTFEQPVRAVLPGTPTAFVALVSDATGRIWGLAAGGERTLLHADEHQVDRMIVAEGLDVAIGAGPFVRVLRADDRALVERWTSSVHESHVRALASVRSTSGIAIATGDGEGRIVVSALAAGDELQRLHVGLPVLALAPLGDHLAVGTSEGVLVLELDCLEAR